MEKRILAVFAHPDDESFGPAGTLAKYASEGVNIKLLCATRGEAGQWFKKEEKKNGVKIESIREKELLKSAEILGISEVKFLDFIDGTLSNNLYHKLAEKIIKELNTFKPQIILTIERRGVSGHLDHIAVSMITTYSYLKTKTANKLYYHCMARENRDKMSDDYFVYFPEGYDQKEITTRIDYSRFWDKKVSSMMAHQSQIQDVERLLKRFKQQPKTDNFILQFHRGIRVKLPETDLFAGIDS